jgi:hypothetical protein
MIHIVGQRKSLKGNNEVHSGPEWTGECLEQTVQPSVQLFTWQRSKVQGKGSPIAHAHTFFLGIIKIRLANPCNNKLIWSGLTSNNSLHLR